ncbi:MAG: hypothetical protein COV91_00625 [Candidatus Taylorbacteria bacterium CG11_big_fil_rev_8_21_14_0_20_46_11]|uniref:Uncharacterized protein n=1 Tax=Candidatus Taylorbacteria bacterium CG11_big_fil_rev_8_21_14_0_20_46_11 TaxID=1975025 RepID=A0A2H0KCY6_9BACT|nr:MAG: hypothetical protein COV91_00625 [Candidatus Taylorbacteria bacterium CG11_big_fil_rev_8_21_14_0_20_46_11]
MNNHAKTLRWLSLIPVAFTVFVLSDWVVRFSLWFMRLPIILLEKVLGFGSGPIGKLMDGITSLLVGLDSIETLSVVATGLLTGSALIYILAIIVPANNESTAKTLATILLTLLVLGLVALFVNGITGENILWALVIAIGILLGWYSIKDETGKETEKHEDFVQTNINRIFVLTLLFTILLMVFFLS